ncbi:MAG: GNAT family N-acetyltransferase [Cyanobacteria bacterium P01_D01_bin.128]
MKDNYQIRLAREDELQLLNDIEEAASTLFENTSFALEVDQESLSIELLQEQQNQDLVWVVVDDQDSPVGFAVIIIMDNRAHLHELSVDPVHGRQGLGTRLMKKVIQVAETSGLYGVTLSTFRDVAWNAPFYYKLGFREIRDEEVGSNLKNIRKKEDEMGLSVSERVLMLLAF